MGFISYYLDYLRKKIEYCENNAAGKNDIYEIKQLLKLVDDLRDEGYFELSDALQKEFDGTKRINAVLKSYNEIPFKTSKSGRGKSVYKRESLELTEYIDKLIKKAQAINPAPHGGAIDEAINFSDSLNFNTDVSYVFLLRDTLLPYIRFKSKHADNSYPLIISRRFLSLIYRGKNFDDVCREIIFEALKSGYDDFESFTAFCKKAISRQFENYPDIRETIKSLLNGIPRDKITVIETGCHGTFPLLLASLDERVTFRMYTAAPYLSKTYKDIIYTAAYENLRGIETLYCHDKLFQLASYRDKNFYVCESNSGAIIKKSLGEISYALK